MIQHVGQVQDCPLAAVGDAEHQVVVLDALVADPEAAEPAQHGRPHRKGMVHVVVGEQAFRVEIRLEARLRAAAMGVQAVLVRIDRGGLGMGCEGVADQGQGVRGQDVVVIEEQHRVCLGQGQGGVGRRRHP